MSSDLAPCKTYLYVYDNIPLGVSKMANDKARGTESKYIFLYYVVYYDEYSVYTECLRLHG